jgi:hypothetical protein
MAKTQDKDLPLKLQFRRILFSQGFWTPLEVELCNYEQLGTAMKRRSLTDLDVLGIKFDGFFNRTCVVGDCKSGKNVSDANRLFWLRGVRDYFGADLAYYLRPKVDSHISAIAPRMRLCALGSSELAEMEIKLNVGRRSESLGRDADYIAAQENWGIALAKGGQPDANQLKKKSVYSFLSYSYWYIERFRTLMQLVGSFETVADLLDPENPRDVLLAFSGAERFALSLLEAAYYVHSHGQTNIPNQARLYLYGGVFGKKEKERVFELIGKLGITGEQLDPPWIQGTIELLGRMIANPNGASDILRHLSAFYYSLVVRDEPSLLNLGNAELNTAAIVLAKDAAFQFAKATGIRESLFNKLNPI